jgi:hypothetical protein
MEINMKENLEKIKLMGREFIPIRTETNGMDFS